MDSSIARQLRTLQSVLPRTETIAAVYCRLSLAAMGDTTKVDDQDRISREVARARGWTVHDELVFKDNSRSAWQRNRKRPGWDAMLAAIERGDAQAIVVYHGDRLIRQPYDLEKLLNIADSKGVRLASPMGSRDLDNPDDRFVLRIEAAQACRESDNTSRRTKNGHRRRREQGIVRSGGRGGRPYGFQTDGVTHVPEEVAVLSEIAQRIVTGESAGFICRDLNARGLATVTGGTWSHGTIKKMLSRPRLVGLMPDGVSRASWEPVLGRETWESVKAVLDGKASAFAYTTNARKYLLTGIAVCGSCGHGLMIRHNTRSESLRGYGCIQPGCKKKVHRSQSHLDAYVEGWVLDLLRDTDKLASTSRPENAAILAELSALEARRQETEMTLGDLVNHPALKPDVLIRSLEGFDRRIAELRERLAVTSRSQLLSRYRGIGREVWRGLPLETRRALVGATCHVVVNPSGRRGPGFDDSTVDVTPSHE